MEQKNIDFSPLKGLNYSFLKNYTLRVALLIAAVVLVIVFGEIIIDTDLTFVALFGFFVIFIYSLYKIIMQSGNNRELITYFATINKWQYEKSSSSINKPGTIFSIGSNKRASDIVSGTLNNLPFFLYGYKYSVGGGESEKTYDFQVFEFTLPRELPHMVIDSLVESGNDGSSTLPITFDKSQKIELEGDFSQYFSLYAPDKFGVTALTILAPDAMEALMNFAAKCDIEIVQNKLYFYWPKTPENQKEFEEIFATVMQVLDKTIDKLTTSDIYSNTDQLSIHASSTNSGVRLKEGWRHNETITWFYFGLIISTILNIIIFKGTTITMINGLILIVGFIGTVIYLVALIMHYLNRKQKQSKLEKRIRSIK